MQVISKLTEGRASHIPYRDSKLTRLLQSSLSGHGRISVRLYFCIDIQKCDYFIKINITMLIFVAQNMKHGYSYILLSFKIQLICTVTPSSSNAEETHNTLKFAHRAKHVEIQAAQNTVYWRFFLLEFYFYTTAQYKMQMLLLIRVLLAWSLCTMQSTICTVFNQPTK